MYHGGTNPVGREPWLQENQRSRYTNYNDLPVMSYDFQTALGEFGQVREQYHLLRSIHLFLQEFGVRLAPMTVVLPEDKVSEQGDTRTFRWAVRTDGKSGFVFVNNYQRLQPMPARPDTQLMLQLKEGTLKFPQTPTTIAADCAFFWPFHFNLGDGITLEYATAQPVCQVRDGDTVYSVFVSTGNPAEFALTGHARATGESAPTLGERIVLTDVTGRKTPIVTLTAKNGTTHQILLLDATTASQCYRAQLGGADRLILTPATVMIDGDTMRLVSSESREIAVSMLPAPASLCLDNQPVEGAADGIFTRYTVPIPKLAPVKATAELVRDAGPLRTIKLGSSKVAEAPADSEFDEAAVWQIKLPSEVDPARNLLLRISYTGDVARAYLGDRLLTDDFYNGRPFEIGLNRFGPSAIAEGITLKVLPLQSEAPIYLHESVRPPFHNKPAVATLDGVEVVEMHEVRFSVK
jgi:beta-galactosidase